MKKSRAPVKRSPVKRSPVKRSPVKRSPVKRSPVKRSPVKRNLVKRSPMNELRLSVLALIRAEIDMAFIGSRMPDEHADIERRYQRAVERYVAAFNFVEHIVGESNEKTSKQGSCGYQTRAPESKSVTLYALCKEAAQPRQTQPHRYARRALVA